MQSTASLSRCRRACRSVRLFFPWIIWIIALALVTLSSAESRAEQAPADGAPACPAGNLLAAASAAAPGLDRARLARLTDDVIVREGSPWPPGDLFVSAMAPVIFDLGRLTTIRKVYLQIDADQATDVDFSTDQANWTRLSVRAHTTASGIISRAFDVPSLTARYLRLSPGEATSAVTFTEIRAFCQPEAKVRRGLRVEGPTEPRASPGYLGKALTVLSHSSAIAPSQATTVKLVVVLLALLAAAIPARKPGGPSSRASAWKRPEPRDIVFLLLATVGVGAYYGFGAYRYPSFVHEHDVFHYFVGAKYFPELGYDELYECAAAAEAEAGFRERVLARTQRDLKTNRIESGADVLRRAGECRSHFTPARFAAFGGDVSYFANTRTVEDWHRVLRDHGFNATPAWIAAGRAVVRSAPATSSFIGHGATPWSGVVVPLDVALLIVSLGALVLGFGCRTASVVAIVFACNPLSGFSWVGGGFLRELWLATLVLGLSALRRERWATGGVLLALSAALQLFPAACLLAIALAAGLDWMRERRMNPAARRISFAAAATLALAVPLSAAAAGRGDAWSAFVANTEKHASTPSGNLVGLPSALSFRMATRAELLFDESAVDPFARLREARRANLRVLRPLEYVGIAFGVAALARALGRRPAWWAAAALGLALIPLALETSSYYTAWLAALTVVGHRRRTALLPLFAFVAVALVLELTIDELDVRCAFASIGLVIGMYALLGVTGSSRFALPAQP